MNLMLVVLVWTPLIDDLSGLTGCNGTGNFARIWTLVDDCGNTTTQTQTVTVEDNLAPSFTVPADVTVQFDINCQLDIR